MLIKKTITPVIQHKTIIAIKVRVWVFGIPVYTKTIHSAALPTPIIKIDRLVGSVDVKFEEPLTKEQVTKAANKVKTAVVAKLHEAVATASAKN